MQFDGQEGHRVPVFIQHRDRHRGYEWGRRLRLGGGLVPSSKPITTHNANQIDFVGQYFSSLFAVIFQYPPHGPVGDAPSGAIPGHNHYTCSGRDQSRPAPGPLI